MENKVNISVILPIKSAKAKDFDEYFAKAMLVKSCALKENLKVVDLFDSLKLARQNNLEDFKRLYVGERRHMSGAGNYFVAKHLTNVINTINN